MTPTQYTGLTGLTLERGIAVTANPAGIACLYSDVVTHRANAAPVDGFERVQKGEIARPEIVTAVDLDLSRLDARIEMLLIDALNQWDRDRALELAPRSGLLVTAPVTLSSHQLGMLGFKACDTVIQAGTLSNGLNQWQHALEANPEIDRWFWLSVDSHCVMDWLLQQPELYAADTHPEGVLAGEALVLTEWHRNEPIGPTVTFAAQSDELNGDNALQAPISARPDLITAAEAEVAKRSPQWAECLTNDSFSQAKAAERYKTEVALWPKAEPQPALGPAEPFISWYAMTGDIGLAALPLGLLLARERLNHPLHERDWVGVMISDQTDRYYWRLQRRDDAPTLAN
ncbi:hypothetical protein [Saccharospirillum salsuginis]|uniref:Uncharacterized protein n=1 Tax=Saccharospirillum salsuginis TaxID=418750 RepID=A0A918K1T7_9GAMM|nr:hypothetical protein [Saccharospirillum salsuginis]GGX38639.1 hypothetical protein GCM10007392_01050 [Saccharospirillum salsuginis]